MRKRLRSFVHDNFGTLLWIAVAVLLLGILFARVLFPELMWLTIALGVLLVAALAALVRLHQKALRSRTAAFGLNSLVTALLVISLVGVLNFLVSAHPLKLDLTQSQKHTLSDQTVKLFKGLKKDVKAVYFAKPGQREQIRPLFSNLSALSTKFEVEYVDPDKEPTRAKAAEIKRYGTLQLVVGNRDQKIEDPTEEKITNALIKMVKDKPQVLCSVTGHGEKDFESAEAEGYESAKKQLANQAYEIKKVNLKTEGKVPESCDAIAILGPTSAFFDAEIKAIRDYLAKGGRAVIAVDVNIKGGQYAPELNAVLKDWYVQPASALIVDPVSRMVGVDAAVPILATYSKDSPITRDFRTESYFPFSRPLETMKGTPAGLNVQWLAQTTPRSWGETNFKELSTGAVKFDQAQDKQGPLTAAVAVEGKQKDSKAARNTRLVVFGTSLFATNNYARFGANLDLFLNAVSWVLEDESMISIRAKEDEPARLELSEKQARFIFLLTIILIPLATVGAGVGIWFMRRKL